MYLYLIIIRKLLSSIFFSSEYNKLKNENGNLKEQLQKFIPRRRVRRIYKLLKNINNLEELQKVIDFLESILEDKQC